MSKTRISTVISKFNTYITSTAIDVESITAPTVQTRFGWTNPECTWWTDMRDKWVDDLYKRYSDKNTSTSVVKKDVRTFIATFRKTANKMLDRAVASPGATSADEALYNFVITKAKPTHRDTPITEKIYPIIEQEGGGVLGFRCRTASDSKKAHLADMADSVQMASAIGRVPANPDDGTEKTVITKAKFQVETGAPGKKFGCYMRWYNTKHPKIASPWCGPFSIDIL